MIGTGFTFVKGMAAAGVIFCKPMDNGIVFTRQDKSMKEMSRDG